MQRRDINAADPPAPAGQYAQAVEVTEASRTLYLSGQVGIASDGSAPEDAEAECALAWRNLQARLRAAGMEAENLVKITTRYSADAGKVRAGRTAVLGTQKPASTLIIEMANPCTSSGSPTSTRSSLGSRKSPRYRYHRRQQSSSTPRPMAWSLATTGTVKYIVADSHDAFSIGTITVHAT